VAEMPGRLASPQRYRRDHRRPRRRTATGVSVPARQSSGNRGERTVRRSMAIAGFVAGVLILGAAPAWAHVTVSPETAALGGFATLTFEVPNETEDATTTEVEVQFPQDRPIADASVQAVPGWTIAVTKKKLTTPVTTDEGDTLTEAVNTITWTAAAGQGIAPGYFEQFQVSV